jgi:hypothetical protein
MTGFSEGYREPLRKERNSTFNIAVIVGISLLSILFRVYVSRFIPYLQYLELPLLVCFSEQQSAWRRIRCRISLWGCSAS